MKFTKLQRERSQQIANDIAEGINNFDNASAMRDAVAYYADIAAQEALKRAHLESAIKMAKIGAKMISIALA